MPGRSRRAEQRRVSPFRILTATRPNLRIAGSDDVLAVSGSRQRFNCASALYVAVRDAICHAQFIGHPASKTKSGRSDMSGSPRSRESKSSFGQKLSRTLTNDGYPGRKCNSRSRRVTIVVSVRADRFIAARYRRTIECTRRDSCTAFPRCTEHEPDGLTALTRLAAIARPERKNIANRSAYARRRL